MRVLLHYAWRCACAARPLNPRSGRLPISMSRNSSSPASRILPNAAATVPIRCCAPPKTWPKKPPRFARLLQGHSTPDAAEKQGNALEAARELSTCRRARSQRSQSLQLGYGAAHASRRGPGRRSLLQAAIACSHVPRAYCSAWQWLYIRAAPTIRPRRASSKPPILTPTDPSAVSVPRQSLQRRDHGIRWLQPNAWNASPACTPRMPGRITITPPVFSRTLAPSSGRCSKKLSASIPISATLFCCSELSSQTQAICRKAIAAYQSAIAASPQLEEAHYRLAMAYRKTANPTKHEKSLSFTSNCRRQSAAAIRTRARRNPAVCV